MRSLSQTVHNQRGQTLVEYLIIIALVGVGSIGLMRVVSQGINDRFASVVGALGGNVQQKAKVEVTAAMLKRKDLKSFATGARERKNGNDSNSSEADSE